MPGTIEQSFSSSCTLSLMHTCVQSHIHGLRLYYTTPFTSRNTADFRLWWNHGSISDPCRVSCDLSCTDSPQLIQVAGKTSVSAANPMSIKVTWKSLLVSCTNSVYREALTHSIAEQRHGVWNKIHHEAENAWLFVTPIWEYGGIPVYTAK